MATSPKRIPTSPNGQLSSMMNGPSYVAATQRPTASPSVNTTPPGKRMKPDMYASAAPRRPYVDPELRNRIGKVRSPLKTRTNIGPGRDPIVQTPVSTRTFYRSHVSAPVDLPGSSNENKDLPVASEHGGSGTTLTTWSYGFTGSKHIENSAPSTNFSQAQMSAISNENAENEDPVRREENRPNESRDEDSESETTEGDLDSTLGLVQKSVTDTAEEDEFGDCTDTDSASENEYRSNEYYNSPKLVVSINEVSVENVLGSGKSTPRLTLSMNFEEEDELGNRYMRLEYRRRAEDLAKKIGTPLDPFYGGKNVGSSQGAQGGDQVVDLERVDESLDGSSQKSIYKSATSGMISVSTTTTEGKPLLGNYLLLESSNLSNPWNMIFSPEMTPTPLDFPRSLPGPDKDRIWRWLNHPLANRRRRSYHDSDQED